MQIGIDIMEAVRFENMDRERMARIFTEREMDYIHKKNMAPETIAGMFCAKEAFFKALGTGVTQNNILDIEILHDHAGAPFYRLSPSMIQNFGRLSTSKMQVSISNTKTVSVAVCIIISSETFLDTFVRSRPQN
jgi:holo-[acyl-carrier protein] synthase